MDRDIAYRVYISDSLKILTTTKVRYFDLVESLHKPKKIKKEETAEEVIQRISNMLAETGETKQ